MLLNWSERIEDVSVRWSYRVKKKNEVTIASEHQKYQWQVSEPSLEVTSD